MKRYLLLILSGILGIVFAVQFMEGLFSAQVLEPQTKIIPRLLLVIPGSDGVRTETIQKNIARLRRDTKSSLACYLYVYKESVPDFNRSAFEPCVVSFGVGWWTDWMSSVPESAVAATDYVVLNIDDVLADQVNTIDIIDIMQRNSLDVATPQVKGSVCIAVHFTQGRRG